MDTNTREFARRFAHYRRIAARGEKVRISSPDGVFVFAREGPGMTGAGLLARLGRMPPGEGLFHKGGSELIEAGKAKRVPARSPWDA
jgi:hypothetical protein